eukprot:symbB.v1.2.007205.t1/scaffold439.1/size205343/8
MQDGDDDGDERKRLETRPTKGDRGKEELLTKQLRLAEASRKPELLVRRGHLRWKDFRYQEALLDFEDAASLEDYGGAASLSLLCLRFCLGIDLGCDNIRGHETCKALADGLSQLWQICWEKYARRLRLLRPRKSLLDPDGDLHYEGGMEILDGTCQVNRHGSAEVGYRLHVNRRSRSYETPLIIYYHGNGEICEEYTGWVHLYEVFPCSILVFDYRGYGWSSGKPTMANLLSDAEQCIEQLPVLLKGHHLPWPWPAPILLMGRSLGGMVATHLIGCMPDRFDGLLLDSAFATNGKERWAQLQEWLGDSAVQADNMLQELSKALKASLPNGCLPGQEQLCILGSEDFVRGFRGPVLVLHGRHDFIVTVENAQKHYDAAVNASDRELFEVDADHNTLAGVPEFWKRQMAFTRMLVQRNLDRGADQPA